MTTESSRSKLQQPVECCTRNYIRSSIYYSKMASLVLLLILLVPTVSLPVAHCNDGDVGFQLTLTHVDAGKSYSKQQLLRRAVARSKARVAALQALAAARVPTAPPAAAAADPITAARVLVEAGVGEYLVHLAIGTPPLPYTAILDTGSDLIWTQCAPCLLCADQPTPYFQATRSATYRVLPCRSRMCAAFLPAPSCFRRVCVYQAYYGDAASSAGVLATETFTFGAADSTRVRVPDVSFGCGSINAGDLANSSGMVGFGRGLLSLVSQLGPSRFSYCLVSAQSPTPSRLYFGAFASLNRTNTSAGSPVQSTPLVVNPAWPSLYFLSLEGISLGLKRLRVDPRVFAIRGKGADGGVFIDSGTAMTWLHKDAYAAVMRELESIIGQPATRDTDTDLDCFPWPPTPRPNVTVTVPDFVFHFDGANMTVPPENYMAIAPSTGNLCLAMAPSTDSRTIIGNYQQQNLHVLYDVANSLLSFVPAACEII